MDTKHFFRTALNERARSDAYFNSIREDVPPPDPNKDKPGAAAPAAPAAQQQAAPAAASAPPPATTPQTPAQNPQAAPAGGATPPGSGTPSAKTVNQMMVTGKAPVQLAPGIMLPAGTPATISAGDLSGNVTVQIGDQTHKVPDANMMQLIKSGNLTVDKSESFASRLSSAITRNGF